MTCTVLLKIMAVMAKVSMLREQLPSVNVIVDPCPYYCCTAHQALPALCTEGSVRTVQLTCMGIRNVKVRTFRRYLIC